MDSETALDRERQRAAEASGGTSNNDIYAIFERVLTQENLAGDLLDYGAGIGNLLHRLKALNRFRSLAGADLMVRPVTLDKDIHWTAQDLHDPLPLPDQSFDVIVCAEVIEHLENPRALVREHFRLLKPGGSLILSTPNNESWRAIGALVLRGHFVFFGDTEYPAHKTALVRKDLDRILREAGFLHPRFQFTNRGGIPFKPVVPWQRVIPFLKGLRFSDNILAIAHKPR